MLSSPLFVKTSLVFGISFYKSELFVFIRNNMLKLLSQQGLNRFLGFFPLPALYQKNKKKEGNKQAMMPF